MEIAPVQGTPTRIPPGRVAVRLNEDHRTVYRELYARYQTVLGDLPVLRDKDFDGRVVKLTPRQLEALNEAFSRRSGEPKAGGGVFTAQERAKNRLFKRLQYLS
jgi:hypothetical protein